MQIAANLSLLFTELPLLERIAAAAAAGFDGVEIQFPYEVPAPQLREALAASGLPLLLINLPAGDFQQGGAGLAAVPQRQAQFDEALATALAYAEQVQPCWVNVLPGRLAEGVEREAALECLVGNLQRTAEAFAERGIAVLCEALNPLDVPGFLVCSAAELREVIERVGHPALAAQLDLYHMARQGIEPAAAVLELAGHIGHVQFADCPGRGEPGTGTVDFASALTALEALRYPGWLAAEYRPQGAGSASLQWLARWREGLTG